MKKEEEKGPMFNVVESPKSKTERIKNEKQEENRRGSQHSAGARKTKTVNEWQKTEGGEKDKVIMTVDTNDGYEHITVEGVIDSGAFDTISPMELVAGTDVRETEMSKKGECYSACNGTKVENKGCTTIEGGSDEEE